MASRAFTARFRSASSSWLASTRTGPRSAGKVLRYPYARTARPLKQLLHAGDQLSQIHRLGFKLLPPSESQQALGQRRTPLRALTRIVEQAQHPRIVRQPLPEQVEAAQDRHQQIVEVVRDPAGELADGVHLLRFEQLGERLLPLTRPLLDAMLQLIVEGDQSLGRSFEFRRALRHALFQFGVQLLKLTRLAISSAKTLTFARRTSGMTGTGT